MRRFKVFCIAGLTSIYFFSTSSYSLAAYIVIPLYSGNNFVANQLVSGNDTIATLFSQQIPDGATFTKWDAASNQYLQISTYHAGSGWSINYGLSVGEGGLLHTPQSFTNLFVGNIWPGYNFNLTLPDFGQPVLTNAGMFLLSCLIPLSSANFYEVVGRNPLESEFVTTLNPLTQLETTTTFHNGSWDNGTPLLAYGQSAFFGLEAVPEPACQTLLMAGILTLACWRKLNQPK
jgi:hypothetical protein